MSNVKRVLVVVFLILIGVSLVGCDVDKEKLAKVKKVAVISVVINREQNQGINLFAVMADPSKLFQINKITDKEKKFYSVANDVFLRMASDKFERVVTIDSFKDNQKYTSMADEIRMNDKDKLYVVPTYSYYDLNLMGSEERVKALCGELMVDAVIVLKLKYENDSGVRNLTGIQPVTLNATIQMFNKDGEKIVNNTYIYGDKNLPQKRNLSWTEFTSLLDSVSNINLDNVIDNFAKEEVFNSHKEKAYIYITDYFFTELFNKILAPK